MKPSMIAYSLPPITPPPQPQTGVPTGPSGDTAATRRPTEPTHGSYMSYLASVYDPIAFDVACRRNKVYLISIVIEFRIVASVCSPFLLFLFKNFRRFYKT